MRRTSAFPCQLRNAQSVRFVRCPATKNVEKKKKKKKQLVERSSEHLQARNIPLTVMVCELPLQENMDRWFLQERKKNVANLHEIYACLHSFFIQ